MKEAGAARVVELLGDVRRLRNGHVGGRGASPGLPLTTIVILAEIGREPALPLRADRSSGAGAVPLSWLHRRYRDFWAELWEGVGDADAALIIGGLECLDASLRHRGVAAAEGRQKWYG